MSTVDPYAKTSMKKVRPPSGAPAVPVKPQEENLGARFRPETLEQMQRAAEAMKVEIQRSADEPRQTQQDVFEDLKRRVYEADKHVVMSSSEDDDDDLKVDLGPLPERYSRVRYQHNSYDNPDVRKAIEARCNALDFDDLILSGRVNQRVSIMPKKLEVTFQSLTGKENLWLSAEAAKAATTFEANVWLGNARLVASITSMNDDIYPDCSSTTGFNLDKFREKFNTIMSKNENVLAILMCNQGWFEDRVQSLLDNDFELLKNG